MHKVFNKNNFDQRTERPVTLNGRQIRAKEAKVESVLKFKAKINKDNYKIKELKTVDKITFHFIVKTKMNMAKLNTKNSEILMEDFNNRINEYEKPFFLVFKHDVDEALFMEKFDPKMCCGQFESIKFYKGNWHLRGYIFSNRYGTILKNLFNSQSDFILNTEYNAGAKNRIFPLCIKIEPIGK